MWAKYCEYCDACQVAVSVNVSGDTALKSYLERLMPVFHPYVTYGNVT